MAYKYIGKNILKQLELVIEKCDSLSHQMEEQKKYYEEKISALELDIKNKDEKIVKLENEIDRLKKQINNDSNNSSKPPSTDNKKNIPNNREYNNRRVGGQFGHKPYILSKKDIEEKIANKEVEHIVLNHGNINTGKYISKYDIDIKISVVVTEHRFYLCDNNKYNIPREYKNDVRYGNDIKSLVSLLSVESSMPTNKIKTTIESITNGMLKFSEGSIINFLNELSRKSEDVLESITDKLLNSEVMQTDETGGRCDGKRISVRNYSNEKYTIYKVNDSKSKKHIDENNILNRFINALVHDHETVDYNYGSRHGECNVHVTRYLKGNTENTSNTWSDDLRMFLLMLNHSKKIAIEFGANCFDNNDMENYEKKYDRILEQGFMQNKSTSSIVYKKDEKKLLNRLKKYKENHLLFIKDFIIPFDNNLSERDLRLIKTKTKISGGFRSRNGSNVFANILSIVKTVRKQGLNTFKTLRDLYKYSTVSI